VLARSPQEPSIELKQVSRDARSAGYWEIGWQVQNLGANALQLTSVRVPHGQFKAAEQQFQPSIELSPGEVAQFKTLVYCNEPMGLVTKNAFVIFAATWLAEAWRIFVRVRVLVSAHGEPEAATELITTQKVGFSGVSN
jgi:hypothetical protein